MAQHCSLPSLSRGLRRFPLRLVLFALLLVPPHAPASPTTFLLDGLRDPGYVLIAEDPANDLAPAIAVQPQYGWADLTRLYVGTDSANLYVYADLPSYAQTQAAGQIGLSIVLPGGAGLGPRTDPLRPQAITYAYTTSLPRGCSPPALLATRHPDILIRGQILGTQDGGGADPSNGYTARIVSGPTDWVIDFADWGGLGNAGVEDRIAYTDGAGVELSIPWADLNLGGPDDLHLSFFTTAAGSPAGNFDALPTDVAASAAPTDTVLSQLATVALPLPAAASVALYCSTAAVDEYAGSALLTAQLHTALTETVAVSYTAAALTAGLADFTPHTGTVTFAPLTTQQTFAIPIADDTVVEGSETFLVTLSSPYGIGLATPVTATVTILDDDVVSLFKLFVPFARR